jgi:hypothetical protein
MKKRRSASNSKQRDMAGELDETRLSKVSGGGGGVPGSPSSLEPVVGGEGVSARPSIKKPVLKPLDLPDNSTPLV